MKKAFSLVMAIAVCLLSLTSCSGSAKLKINGTKIDNEVYEYFYDLTSENKEETKKAIIRYVTINSEFANRNLTLTPSQKSKLSEKVDDLWHIYGIYYQDLGISKQTIYKVELSGVYEDVLLDYYYGQDGVEPVSEETLKKHFKKNYIAISFATEYLFNIDENGATVPMTDAEKAVVINSFTRSVGLINTGSLVEEATDKDVYDTIINSSSDGSFPKGFYKSVAEIKEGSAEMVTLEDYVFLVKRIDVFDETYNYYERYRTDCLRALKGKAFEKMVDQWSQSYKAD